MKLLTLLTVITTSTWAHGSVVQHNIINDCSNCYKQETYGLWFLTCDVSSPCQRECIFLLLKEGVKYVSESTSVFVDASERSQCDVGVSRLSVRKH